MIEEYNPDHCHWPSKRSVAAPPNEVPKRIAKPGAKGQTRGNAIRYDEQMDVWRYVDDDAPIHGYGGVQRPCVKCGVLAEPDGPDPCLGRLPDGVTSACCGHGVETGYIIWEGVAHEEVMPVESEHSRTTGGHKEVCDLKLTDHADDYKKYPGSKEFVTAPEVEPVAWRWRYKTIAGDEDRWEFRRNKPDLSSVEYQIQPLYASPPEVTEEMVGRGAQSLAAGDGVVTSSMINDARRVLRAALQKGEG